MALKKINDQYGHLFGDDVLRGLAALMKEIFGGENLVGRFGGDEFVIFTVKEWDAGKAIEKGKELIRRMEAMGRKMGVKRPFFPQRSACLPIRIRIPIHPCSAGLILR